MANHTTSPLSDITHRAHARYAARLAGEVVPWWSAVIVTASSARQAERYAEEIRRRQACGALPAGVPFLTVPDLDDARIGSGGATLNALRVLTDGLPGDDAWWAAQRVLMIHSGGDSRRLPQYSLSGKLFSVLPVQTPWGEVSTLFDELLALSTLWVPRVPDGLVVVSGDVLLTLDDAALRLDRPGVTGVATLTPLEVGRQHGIYIADADGRVYDFLQKPSTAAVAAAGGLFPGDQVAVDTGLLRFDAPAAARLTAVGRAAPALPAIDLYEHFTFALTGAWQPGADDHPVHRALAGALHGTPFWCARVAGAFTHIGTTSLFRRLLTEETDFSALYATQGRLGVVTPPGVRSAGVILDSVLTGGGEIGPGAVVLECHLDVPVHAWRGAMLHGLTALTEPVRVPEDTVAHQVPVRLPDGRAGVIIRVYGVADDPKAPAATGTWLGRPLLESLAALGLTPGDVWPDTEERTLWNAALFPVGTPAEAWAWARGLLDGNADLRGTVRLSLASSAACVDGRALTAAQARRMQARWQTTALALAEAGSDVRPLLADPPGIAVLAATGHALTARAAALPPTEAASRLYQAGLFFGHAGLAAEADAARAEAFRRVRQAVDAGADDGTPPPPVWRHQVVTVSAPARVDLGGGWSDTPPFCLDWGGTVLNLAVTINGAYPITTTVRRLDAPLVRCCVGEACLEFTDTAALLAPPEPGSPFSIPRAALRLLGLAEAPLTEALRAAGGGVEIRTHVALPMGSGLGTSSILGATVVQALAALAGTPLPAPALIARVLRLEQLMTTGGGWQDQVGGIMPGAKLIRTGPGLRQQPRVAPIAWSAETRCAFCDRFVLYDTGLQRIAKNLLTQVVGGYLAREAGTVQVLHSIKTLAEEMAHALAQGDWPALGALLDRHWALNLQLDPHTTNAPINALLADARPYLAGAKLAGAGGGGFLLLLARDPDAARALRAALPGAPGTVVDFAIADDGLRLTIDGV
jgi:fucokinase